MPVIEGRFSLDEALQADEIYAMSSTRDLLPVSAIGEAQFDVSGPMLVEMREAMRAATRHYE